MNFSLMIFVLDCDLKFIEVSQYAHFHSSLLIILFQHVDTPLNCVHVLPKTQSIFFTLRIFLNNNNFQHLFHFFSSYPRTFNLDLVCKLLHLYLCFVYALLFVSTLLINPILQYRMCSCLFTGSFKGKNKQ